ncbi:MAG: YggU family protein [Thermoplasmata archaeon]|nr:YggU family protein [Thermoplasmata archaeon]
MMKDALIAHAKAVSIRLEITPRSKESGIQGYDEWRKRIRVSLREEARGGAANKELLRMIGKLFEVDRDSIKITEGLRSRRKTVTVAGIGLEDALRTLTRGLQ